MPGKWDSRECATEWEKWRRAVKLAGGGDFGGIGAMVGRLS